MAGENVSAVTPNFGMPMMYNSYVNGVMLDDMFSCNPMSMGGSVFGGMTMPFMPSFGGTYNYDTYFDNYNRYQDFMYDSQIRQREKYREINFRANAPEEVILKQIDILHEKIMQNEQEQIIPALKSVIESIKATSGDQATQEELIARAGSIYQQRYNTTLADDIRKYGHGSLTQGFLQTLTIGLADKRTAEENIAIINNQPVSRTENAKKLAGNGVGGAVLGSAGLYLLSTLKFAKNIFKSKPAVAACIGAVIGLLSGIGIGAVNKGSRKELAETSLQE